MITVSEIKTTAPAVCKTDLQKAVYQTLGELRIPYERVDGEPMKSLHMEDCIAVNKKLNIEMVKTLFLANRQHTRYYLFITCGDKPFHAKEFSSALGIARVFFAPAEKMETMLTTQITGDFLSYAKHTPAIIEV